MIIIQTKIKGNIKVKWINKYYIKIDNVNYQTYLKTSRHKLDHKIINLLNYKLFKWSLNINNSDDYYG